MASHHHTHGAAPLPRRCWQDSTGSLEPQILKQVWWYADKGDLTMTGSGQKLALFPDALERICGRERRAA